MSHAKQMSPNVIECPTCRSEIGEEDACIAASKKPNHFRVTCKLCKHKWEPHHRDFYRRGGEKPTMRNPFRPLRIPLP